MSEDMLVKARGVVGTYYGFIAKRLDEIYEAWDSSNFQLAMHRAIRLYYALPKDAKKRLKEQREKIEKLLKLAYKVDAPTWISSQLVRNKIANQIASNHLAAFMDTLTDLLDEKHWFELRGAQPQNPEAKHITSDQT